MDTSTEGRGPARRQPSPEQSALDAALEATRLLVLVVDAQGRVVQTNRAVDAIDASAAERRVWELAFAPEERVRLRALFDPLDVRALPPSLLFHLVAVGGSPRVIDWDVCLVDDPASGPRAVFCGLDMTERLSTEHNLRESETLQRQVLDHLPAIIWATDRALRFTFSAGGGLTSLGLRPGEVAQVGTSLYSYFQTNDPHHDAIAPHLRALQGESGCFETRWFDRLFQARIEPLRDAHDDIVGCIGLALDVTEQTRMKRALDLSEARLRRLVDANVLGVFFWREDGRITEANDAFLELIGASRDEVRAGTLSWRDRTPPEHHLADDRAIEQIRAAGACAVFEKELLASDGTRVPVLVGGAVLDDSPSQPLEGVAFVIDQREQARLRAARDELLRAEQAARHETERANSRLRLLLEGSTRLARTTNVTDTLEALAAVVVPALADWSYIAHRGWDGDTKLVATAHADPEKAELLRRLHECSPDPAAPEGAPRVFRTGEAVLYESVTLEHLSPTGPAWPIVGTRHPAHLHLLRELGMRSLLCVPIRGRTGVDAVMMLVSVNDPHRYDTHDIALAGELASRAAASLERLRLLSEAFDAVQVRDDFLAVAAHELRTPLTSLLLQVQMLGAGLEQGAVDPATARRRIASAESQARRLSTLVDGLLDVARAASRALPINVEDVDLRRLLDELVANFGPELQRAGCAISVRGPERAPGRWDKMRIEQVVANLLSNAIKFGAGRPIEVELTARGDAVTLAVQDHGIGVDRLDRERIFERFERAVSSGHFGGLGLGLYISTQIARAHHGSLRVDSEPGQGARFTLELPREVEPPAATA